jgi:hypothetical protein
MKAVTPRTTVNAEATYHTVNRAASESWPLRAAPAEFSWAFFEDIACASHGVNQLDVEGFIHLGS